MSGLRVGADEARAAAAAVLDLPGADGVEVVVNASSAGVTRYANSQIIQNTERDELRVYVRVVTGGRAAAATTNQLSPGKLERAARAALEAAESSPPDEDFPGLADPAVVGRAEPIGRCDEATSQTTAAERAAAVRGILAAAAGGSAAGIVETGTQAYGVFNSNGIDCFDTFTRAVTTALVDDGVATGWAEASSHAVGDLDWEGVGRVGAEKAAAGHDAGDAAPGEYEVVLEPPAVAVLLDYLSYVGFGAKQVLDGESFLASRTGAEVAAPSVTITDDAWHPRSVGIGFDFEGVPRRRVAVIDGGIAREPVTDLRTAPQVGSEPTGHNSGSNEFGPYASNVVLEVGDQTYEDLVGGVSDGLLVTRFHYVNVLDRPSTLLTGMTRDGTFRIRDGAIAEPVRNLRFSQSVLEALASVAGVGRDLSAFAPDFSSFGSTVAPAVRVGAFRFSSGTSH
ncbi:MAG TPA: metallopeptidase TldD-related protein [Actinomycetota bacterium]|nr:metallopeptidase TldD-related protein [Actinomycetota bacterium]